MCTSFVCIAEFWSAFKITYFPWPPTARTHTHREREKHAYSNSNMAKKGKKSKLGIIWPEGALITIQFSSLHDVIVLDELE